MSKTKRILVVGSGIAGLIAALELSRKHAVTLVTKANVADSNTRWAQGGIAAAMFSDDSVANHIADTLAAGAGLCNPNAVNILCTEGPARIRDLIRLGVAFDHAENGQFSRGLEAAHSYPRVLHAGGDSTGFSIETALVRAVRAQPTISVGGAGIRVLEHTFVRDLTLQNGVVTGLEVIDSEGLPHTIEADAIILASGGAGQLYLHTTNPSVATGDGVALALRAGAQLTDAEFYQFHPTALAAPPSIPSQNLSSRPESASFADAVERPLYSDRSAQTPQSTTQPTTVTFLISEAVRGEGAILLDTHGRRFMQSIHPAAELAPRDVVARGIASQMAAQQGQPVLLDATAMSADFLRTRFPSIDAATRARNLDWSRDPIPVTPAAHYWMGGIRTDLHGRTSIPNLYAVGEAACTGVHGANRLASNSLLESLVFAWRCAHLLLANESENNESENNESEQALNERFSPPEHALPHAPKTSSSRPESAFFADAVERPLYFADAGDNAWLNLNTHPASHTQPVDRLTLQTLLWTHVGIERTRTSLEAAATQLSHWHAEGATVEALETRNLLDLARVIVTAALAREESRGAHYRTDFPEPSAAFQHSLIYQQPEPHQPSERNQESGCPMSGFSDMGSQDSQTPTEPAPCP